MREDLPDNKRYLIGYFDILAVFYLQINKFDYIEQTFVIFVTTIVFVSHSFQLPLLV